MALCQLALTRILHQVSLARLEYRKKNGMMVKIIAREMLLLARLCTGAGNFPR